MKNLFVLFFAIQLFASESQFFDVTNLKVEWLSDRTPKKGYNYKKQAKKRKRKEVITRLFNIDNCNYYRRNGRV